MSEEMLAHLLDLIDAKVEEQVKTVLGQDCSIELQRFIELKQEFIDVFIFGD